MKYFLVLERDNWDVVIADSFKSLIGVFPVVYELPYADFKSLIKFKNGVK